MSYCTDRPRSIAATRQACSDRPSAEQFLRWTEFPVLRPPMFEVVRQTRSQTAHFDCLPDVKISFKIPVFGEVGGYKFRIVDLPSIVGQTCAVKGNNRGRLRSGGE